MRSPKIFIICGPPAVGKSTVLAELEQDSSFGLVRVLSVTTRPKLYRERDGIDYHFVSENNFRKLKTKKILMTNSKRQFGFEYGVRTHDLLQPLNEGRSVLMETHLEGVKLIKRVFSDVIAIFLHPVSLAVLRSRIVMRGRDDVKGMQPRLQEGRKMMLCFSRYPIDYSIVNDSLQVCIADVKAVIEGEIDL